MFESERRCSDRVEASLCASHAGSGDVLIAVFELWASSAVGTPPLSPYPQVFTHTPAGGETERGCAFASSYQGTGCQRHYRLPSARCRPSSFPNPAFSAAI